MNRKVLLIEDDANYRKLILSLFPTNDYQLIEAASPEEGIAELKLNPRIHVVLLNLSFRYGTPGTAVLDHIKERSDDYRVIVLATPDELLYVERACEYVVFNFLPKGEQPSSQAIRFSIDQAFNDLERVHLHRKVRFLLDVQKRVTASWNTTQTLDLICQAVRSTVGAYTCHIRVYDFARGDYCTIGFAGPDRKIRRVFEQRRAKGDLFSGTVVASGHAAVFDDMQNMEEFQRFKAVSLERLELSKEEESYWQTVRSAYILPIFTGLFGNTVDAVLNVSSESKGFFNEENRGRIEEFITLVALAIAKDWLQKKREEVHQDYSQISGMLSEISDRLKGTEILRGVYEVVTRRISRIINAEVVSILLYNDETGLVENVAELRGSEFVNIPNEVYRPGQSLTGSVYASDSTIQLPTTGDIGVLKPLEDSRFDLANKEAYLRNIPSGQIEHYLGVPIRIGGKIRGVFRAINKKSTYYGEALGNFNRLCLLERGFSADCRNLMEITASHLAAAIGNAELLKEKEWQVEQIRSLGEVGRLINSALDIDEVLSLTIRKMAEVMHAEICMLFLSDGEDRVVLKQCFGMPMIPGASYRIGEGIIGEVAETGEPRLMMTTKGNDGKYDPIIRAFLTEKHGERRSIESVMVVPIIAKSNILGAMTVINKIGSHLKYGDGSLELFRTFADYVGVALENAHIYRVANDRLAIAERNAALSLLVAAVAHEINNTSGLIPANVAGVKAQLRTPNKNIEHMLALIEDAANQATEFANELAGFSANRSGDKRALDINQVIQSTIEALKFDLPRYKNSEGIRLEVSLWHRPLVCEIFKTPFMQIVRNVVINAFQALESKRRGGFVRVSTSEGTAALAGSAVIHIEDDGPGIKPENINKIFDPDFTTKPKGNGVGLWLVRTQLELVGGRIDVTSELGRGAKFIIRVPLSTGVGGRLREATRPSTAG